MEQGGLFPRERVRVLSYGGGLDSFAMLLAARRAGRLPALVVFADVGDPEGRDPGEWPGTYRHIREVVVPLCRSWGVEFVWLDSAAWPIRGARSLFAYFESRRIMPSRLSRLCTAASKVERITRYLFARYGAHGAAVEVWIGFEAGEEERARRDPHAAVRGADGWRVNRFPLLEAGLCRCRCEALVREEGFPVPRKSACVYCPFASRRDFARLRDELPEVFARVAALEEGCRRTKKGKVLRFGYQRGDGSDPTLAEWVARPFASRRGRACAVCGAAERATKAAGCGWLVEGVANAA